MKDRHDFVAKLLVAAEVAADEKEISAKLARPPRWHAATDAVAPGFIDAASTTLPPTAMGLFRREGSNSCSTDA